MDSMSLPLSRELTFKIDSQGNASFLVWRGREVCVLTLSSEELSKLTITLSNKDVREQIEEINAR